MLIQEEMIDRVRQLCREDQRVTGAFMYGSFTLDEGDRFADIEFWVYMDEADLQALDRRAWIAQVAPVALYFINEFGTGAVIFENLVRGEFHFVPTAQMAALRAAKATGGRFAGVERTLLADPRGLLREHLEYLSGPGPNRATPETLTGLWQSFLNGMLFGANVLARGERARALEMLSACHRCLLGLARVRVGSVDHWPTPSRAAEHDLPPAVYARFAACTAGLEPGALERAYRAAWAWGQELALALAEARPFETYPALVRRMGAYFDQIIP